MEHSVVFINTFYEGSNKSISECRFLNGKKTLQFMKFSSDHSFKIDDLYLFVLGWMRKL